MAKERIEDIVNRFGNEVAEKLGYELVDVEYRKEGPDWVLRFFIDCPSGVGIDECQRYSEAISVILDKEDPIPGSYNLEISSPGLERPLKKDQDFLRFTGNNVEIKLHQAIEGQKIIRGQLEGTEENEDGLTVLVKINNITIMKIPRKTIAKANLVSEIFNPKGGRKK